MPDMNDAVERAATSQERKGCRVMCSSVPQGHLAKDGGVDEVVLKGRRDGGWRRRQKLPRGRCDADRGIMCTSSPSLAAADAVACGFTWKWTLYTATRWILDVCNRVIKKPLLSTCAIVQVADAPNSIPYQPAKHMMYCKPKGKREIIDGKRRKMRLYDDAWAQRDQTSKRSTHRTHPQRKYSDK